MLKLMGIFFYFSADGLSSATVIGIVFAALFFISICLFCAILVTKKKKFRPNQLVQPTNQQYTNNSKLLFVYYITRFVKIKTAA